MMIKKIVCVGALLACSPLAAAEHGGSMEDQIACTPDVYRLCAAQIPNEPAIVACLTRNKANLSPDCNAVFSRPEPKTAQPSEDD